jgi:hypothetical protein
MTARHNVDRVELQAPQCAQHLPQPLEIAAGPGPGQMLTTCGKTSRGLHAKDQGG